MASDLYILPYFPLNSPGLAHRVSVTSPLRPSHQLVNVSVSFGDTLLHSYDNLLETSFMRFPETQVRTLIFGCINWDCDSKLYGLIMVFCTVFCLLGREVCLMRSATPFTCGNKDRCLQCSQEYDSLVSGGCEFTSKIQDFNSGGISLQYQHDLPLVELFLSLVYQQFAKAKYVCHYM